MQHARVIHDEGVAWREPNLGGAAVDVGAEPPEGALRRVRQLGLAAGVVAADGRRQRRAVVATAVIAPECGSSENGGRSVTNRRVSPLLPTST